VGSWRFSRLALTGWPIDAKDPGDFDFFGVVQLPVEKDKDFKML
jgi:hypothetical protein